MSNTIKTAIWLDSDKAYIFINNNGNESFETLHSDIEHHVRYSGETDAGSRFGNQYTNNEKKLDERRKHQEHDYYKSIIKHISNSDSIMICGPAQAKKGLEREIKNTKSLDNKLIEVIAADSMTENQVHAYLKEYISKN